MKLIISLILSAGVFATCKTSNSAASRNLRNGLSLKDCNKDTSKNCEPNSSNAGPAKGGENTDPSQDSLEIPADQFAKGDSPNQVPVKGDGKPNPMPSPPPVDLSVPQPIPTPLPQQLKCSSSTIHFVAGPGRCKPNYAAFAADDNKAIVLACCPLPASDILLPGEPIQRAGECADQEVAVGSSVSGLLCAKINNAFYTLSKPSVTCYLGQGFSGGAGAQKCTAPLEIEKSFNPSFGSDACLPTPYGGLITKRTSKYCRDVSGGTVLYKSNMQPVPMFQ